MSRSQSPPRSSRFRLRPRRLATSLLLAFLVLASLPVIGSAVFSAVVQTNLARESAFDKLDGVAAVKSQQLQGWVDARQTALWLNLTDETTYQSVNVTLAGQADADTLAQKIANPKSVNLVVLGFALAQAGKTVGGQDSLFCSFEDIKAVLKSRFAKNEDMLAASMKALQAGHDAECFTS